MDLFKGSPPYDQLPKDARVAFWLLRPDPEKRSGQHWKLTHYRREEGRTNYEGTGWENGVITLLGTSYEFAQTNYDQFVETMTMLNALPKKQVLRQPGFRPTTVQKAINQTRAEWNRFLSHFMRRFNNDRATLEEGGWPLPEHWPLPWETDEEQPAN